ERQRRNRPRPGCQGLEEDRGRVVGAGRRYWPRPVGLPTMRGYPDFGSMSCSPLDRTGARKSMDAAHDGFAWPYPLLVTGTQCIRLNPPKSPPAILCFLPRFPIALQDCILEDHGERKTTSNSLVTLTVAVTMWHLSGKSRTVWSLLLITATANAE